MPDCPADTLSPPAEDTSPLITDAIEEALDEALEELSEKSLNGHSTSSTTSSSTTTTAASSSTEDEESRRSRLNQIKELLRRKPGFASRTARPSFPLVRRASTASPGRPEQTSAGLLPRLLSLELFNPETDDLDSDSSGVSSPESVGSVISVISDERYVSKKSSEGTSSDSSKENNKVEEDKSSGELEKSPAEGEEEQETASEQEGKEQSVKLLEAAAEVASKLEDAVSRAVERKGTERPASVETTVSEILFRKSICAIEVSRRV